MDAESSPITLRPARAGLIADGVRVQSGDSDSDNVAWRKGALKQEKTDWKDYQQGITPNKEKQEWLEKYQQLSHLPRVPRMVMEQGRIGTVFILTSGSDSSAKQLEYAEVMFKEQLKFSQVITLQGINSDDKESFPSGKDGPTSSMAWILAFGPKILSTLKRSGIKPDEAEPSSRSFKDTSWRRPLHIRRNFPSGLW